jgi:predicted GIY-YIG superfamily endonuclease
MKKEIREAFLAARDDCSPDMVIADPQRNQRFIQECRARGLAAQALELNLLLLNARKAGDLQDVPKSKRVVIRDQEEYRFASEIAARFLERRDQISLDQILCSPDRATEFDEVCRKLAPGFSSLQYRWAAFNLRKRKRLKPELLSKVVVAETVITCKVKALQLDQVPGRQGLYLFLHPEGVLYVGECKNLRKRLGKHLEHSDNKGFARWLWARGVSDLHVEYHVLPLETTTRIRKALEAELILSRRPIFNVAGTGTGI